MVVIEPDWKDNLTTEDLREFLTTFVNEGLLSKWAIPDTFYFVEHIPRTSVGKINKKVIRENIAEGDAETP